MEEHNRSEELGLETEGAIISEKEIKEMTKNSTEVDYPMPGEVVDPKKEHLQTMPEGEVEIIDEEGRRII